MTQHSKQTVLFESVFRKKTVVVFDAEAVSSDGGAVLLAALDRGIGLTAALAGALVDRRDPSKVIHAIDEQLRQRIYGMALGYEDCNDVARIGHDPVVKAACGHPAVADSSLASQPTLSRFENRVTARELIACQQALEDQVIKNARKRNRKTRLITIDLDPTIDLAHGEQQYIAFSGFVGEWCYHPLLGFVSFDGDPEQYLFYARLRPGNTSAKRGAISLLRRVIPKLRKNFPKAKIRVRLDAGFAAGRMFEALEDLQVEYLCAMPKNPVLLQQHEAEAAIAFAEVLTKKSGETATVFTHLTYRARPWARARRVVLKAEVVVHDGREPRLNPRFVVTNLRLAAEKVYDVYRQRGDIENRIKELENGLSMGRTSCTRFLSNQFRLLQVASAYVLFQEMRARIPDERLARAQVWRVRDIFLKVAARVVETVRRIVLHMPTACPYASTWRQLALAVGAIPR